MRVFSYIKVHKNMTQNLRALLANIKENETEAAELDSKEFHSRVLLIDGLNLFFRNFATINFLNKEGVPIGNGWIS